MALRRMRSDYRDRRGSGSSLRRLLPLLVDLIACAAAAPCLCDALPSDAKEARVRTLDTQTQNALRASTRRCDSPPRGGGPVECKASVVVRRKAQTRAAAVRFARQQCDARGTCPTRVRRVRDATIRRA